ECSMVNDDLLNSIIHLFTRGGITELGKYNDKSSGLLRDLWKSLDLVYVELTEIFRQNDPEFKHHCTNLRYEFLNEDTFQYLKKCNYLEDDA
ncbi:30580_t:CDS:2, partial [Racocetra persica]